MQKFEFERPAKKYHSEEEILLELEKVAKLYNYEHFRRKDFDAVADIHSATIERHFGGSWSKGLKALELRLQSKNIVLKPASRHARYTSEREMFEEIERIWLNLGHRPSRNEWTAARPKISYDTIYRRFNGWTNACKRFIEHKTGEVLVDEDLSSEDVDLDSGSSLVNNSPNIEAKEKKPTIQRTRSISLNIRIKVLSRDNFRCVFCGKSPATDLGTKLHIDHIIPFSKGGTNDTENLQTLCEACNIGKSNSETINSPTAPIS